jgi:hypothetical protein
VNVGCVQNSHFLCVCTQLTLSRCVSLSRFPTFVLRVLRVSFCFSVSVFGGWCVLSVGPCVCVCVCVCVCGYYLFRVLLLF